MQGLLATVVPRVPALTPDPKAKTVERAGVATGARAAFATAFDLDAVPFDTEGCPVVMFSLSTLPVNLKERVLRKTVQHEALKILTCDITTVEPSEAP